MKERCTIIEISEKKIEKKIDYHKAKKKPRKKEDDNEI